MKIYTIYRMRIMNKLSQFYQTQSTNTKISLVFIGSVVAIISILTISLAIQYKNVSYYQQQIPNNFFKPYNKASLESITQKLRSLMLAIIDYRASFILSIKNCILNSKVNFVPTGQMGFSKQSNKTICELTKPQQSIFNCSLNYYTKFLLEEEWQVHIVRMPARRVNIIYQNLQDEEDIMVKSISSIQDISIKNAGKIKEKFKKLKQGDIQLSSFYTDQYGYSSQQLVSYTSKIVFQKYQILIELQSYAAFIHYSIKRVLYTDDTNIVVLAFNNTVAEGYSVVANFEPMSTQINYTNLLKTGHQQIPYSKSQTIYSFTTTLSSVYTLGTLNYGLGDDQDNRKLVIVVYSFGPSQQKQLSIYQFITTLNMSLNQLLGVYFTVLFILLTANSLILCQKIGILLRDTRECIKTYTIKPNNYFEIVSFMENLSYTDNLIKPFARAVQFVLRSIQSKKKKFKAVTKSQKHNKYPLNTFQKQFLRRQLVMDEINLQIIKQKILKKAKKPLQVIDEQKN